MEGAGFEPAISRLWASRDANFPTPRYCRSLSLSQMGETGFEPATPDIRNWRATTAPLPVVVSLSIDQSLNFSSSESHRSQARNRREHAFVLQPIHRPLITPQKPTHLFQRHHAWKLFCDIVHRSCVAVFCVVLSCGQYCYRCERGQHQSARNLESL